MISPPPPAPAFNAKDAVNAYDEERTLIEEVCEFLTKFCKSFNNAIDAEDIPATFNAVSATAAVLALDADGTIPITLAPLIAPLIFEPPLPTTTTPEVKPLNTTLTLLLSNGMIA